MLSSTSTLFAVFVGLFAIIYGVWFLPLDFDPLSFDLPPPIQFPGDYTPNSKLFDIKRTYEGVVQGPVTVTQKGGLHDAPNKLTTSSFKIHFMWAR